MKTVDARWLPRRPAKGSPAVRRAIAQSLQSVGALRAVCGRPDLAGGCPGELGSPFGTEPDWRIINVNGYFNRLGERRYDVRSRVLDGTGKPEHTMHGRQPRGHMPYLPVTIVCPVCGWDNHVSVPPNGSQGNSLTT